MPKFGDASRRRLATCVADLQDVFSEVIKHVDCTILCGHRTKEEQEMAFLRGNSKVQFPNSKHNSLPSLAVDAAPYPIDWNDKKRFALFAGFVLGIAATKGIRLRWGGDWNMNYITLDNRFDDLPHFELVQERTKQNEQD